MNMRALLALLVLNCGAPCYGSELTEALPLTDRVILLHFDDGYIRHHERGMPRTREAAIVDPLNVSAASITNTYRVTSPDDSNWQAAAPVQIWRKSKGTDFGWFMERWENGRAVNSKPDHAKEHWVYLVLPGRMKEGKRYEISTGNLATNGSKHLVAFDSSRHRSEAVHVNLVGYKPSAPKKFGYVYQWVGDGGSLQIPEIAGRVFYILNAGTREKVFQGVVKFRKTSTNEETGHKVDSPPHGNFLKADVWECEFSGFKTPGDYVLSVPGVGCSFPFKLSEDLYRPVYQAVTRALYHNRSGIALEKPFTSFTRPAPHNPKLTPGFAGKLLYTSLRWQEWGSEAGNATNLMKHAKGPIEAWGWYQDAGDWDSYESHLRVPREMLFAFELAPGNFVDGELNIPESGNGIPDFLDEAAWLPRFCHRLRHELMEKKFGTGGLGLRIAGDAFGGDEKKLPDGATVGQGSWEDVDRTWVASGEDPWATYGYAGVAAHLAYCLELIGKKDPQGVDWAREAREAFRWAQANTLPGDEKSGLDHARSYAAAALFRITGEEQYHQQFLKDTGKIKPGTDLWDGQKYGALVYAMGGGKLKPSLEAEQRIRAALLAMADHAAISTPGKRALRWAGNWWFPMVIGQQTTPMVFEVLAGYALTRKADPQKAQIYLSAIQTSCDYVMGCNALNMTFITGVGPRYPRHVFHMDAWYNGQTELHPGLIPYGHTRKTRDLGQGPWDPDWPNKTVYPPIDEWPANERFFDNRCSPVGSEFTVHQNLGPAAAVYGFLCAPAPAGEKVLNSAR